ncbi:MAG: PKD domain-containing protein [Deltaproteobacteria bacterium]|nr:PKD domain-containing protein [Deltaproteobacteria bacterium]
MCVRVWKSIARVPSGIVLVLLMAVAPMAGPAVAKSKPKVSPAAPLPPILLKLIVDIDADPTSGPPPLKVELTGDVYDSENIPGLRYEWDFGDGSRKEMGVKAVHVYKKPGDYTVILRATAPGGRTGMDQLDIQVEGAD